MKQITYSVPPCFVAVSLLLVFPASLGLAMCYAGIDERIALISVVLIWGACCRKAWHGYTIMPQPKRDRIRYMLSIAWFVAQGFTLSTLIAQMALLLFGIDGSNGMVLYFASGATGAILGGLLGDRFLVLGSQGG